MSKIKKETTSTLKKIAKSEKSLNYAYFHITKADIRKKIKEEIEKKDGEKDFKPHLSSAEKKRVFNIGNSLIKGGTEYYEKLIKNIKKSEKKKLAEISKRENALKEKEKEKKNNVKKNKAAMAIKLGLLGIALGTTVYFFKEIYDYIIKSPTFLKIEKFLEKLKPTGLRFNIGSTKKIDGITSSFSLKTVGGEEISISDKKRETNPVENAAKTFDVIMTDEVLGKNGGGFNKFLNSVESTFSPVGYFISHPFFYFVGKLKKYLYNSLYSPALLARGWKEFYQFSLGDTLAKAKQFVETPIVNRYSQLQLKSQDIFERKRIELGKKINDKLIEAKHFKDDGNHKKLKVNDYYSVSLFNSNIILDNIIKNINPNDPLSFFRLIHRIQTEELELDFSSTFAGYVSSNTIIHISSVNKKGEKGLSPLVDITGLWINREKGDAVLDDDVKKNVLEDLNILLDGWEKHIKDFFKTEQQTLYDLMALKMYYEHFLLPKEILSRVSDIGLKTNFDDFNEKHLEAEIYFNKERKTGEKMKMITDSYFSKDSNFFTKYLSKLENGLNDVFSKIFTYISRFDSEINAFHHLLTHENFDGHDELKKIMEHHYKNHDLIITESNISGESVEPSFDLMVNNMVLFSNKKMEFRKNKSMLLERLYNNLKAKLIAMIDKHGEYYGYVIFNGKTNEQYQGDGVYFYGLTGEGKEISENNYQLTVHKFSKIIERIKEIDVVVKSKLNLRKKRNLLYRKK